MTPARNSAKDLLEVFQFLGLRVMGIL
jgi:hypothetical protein